jgi:hypothetical protein
MNRPLGDGNRAYYRCEGRTFVLDFVRVHIRSVINWVISRVNRQNPSVYQGVQRTNSPLLAFLKGGGGSPFVFPLTKEPIVTKESFSFHSDNYYTCPMCYLRCHIDDVSACNCYEEER